MLPLCVATAHNCMLNLESLVVTQLLWVASSTCPSCPSGSYTVTGCPFLALLHAPLWMPGPCLAPKNPNCCPNGNNLTHWHQQIQALWLLCSGPLDIPFYVGAISYTDFTTLVATPVAATRLRRAPPANLSRFIKFAFPCPTCHGVPW